MTVEASSLRIVPDRSRVTNLFYFGLSGAEGNAK